MKGAIMKIEKVFDAVMVVIVMAIAVWTLVSGSGFDSRHATAVVVYFIVADTLIVRIFKDSAKDKDEQ